jgi:hypothetical protein
MEHPVRWPRAARGRPRTLAASHTSTARPRGMEPTGSSCSSLMPATVDKNAICWRHPGRAPRGRGRETYLISASIDRLSPRARALGDRPEAGSRTLGPPRTGAAAAVCICSWPILPTVTSALDPAISRAGRGVARAGLRGPQAAPSLAPVHSAASTRPSRQTSAPACRRRIDSSAISQEEPGGPPARSLREKTRSRAADRGVIATGGSAGALPPVGVTPWPRTRS